MQLIRYGFANAVGGFFEMATSAARRILPSHLQPVEVQHQRSVLAVLAFDFTDSMVGAYQELVLSVVVPPLVQPGTAFPKSAFYPFQVGTSSRESREHAIERWHLPHHMADIQVDLLEEEGRMRVAAREGEAPILDLVVTRHDFEPIHHLHQSFMTNGAERFRVNIHMEADHCEHEEEAGSLVLHPHGMTTPLEAADVSTYPFREQWMKAGVQTFEELESF